MKRILIVDDHKDFRDSLAIFLKDENYETITTSTGKNAINLISLTDFDLVLLDLKLPHMDGIATLQKIKSIKKDLPVIIITAYGDIGSAVEAIKLGASDYITKPFDNEELLIRIKKVIDSSKLSTLKQKEILIGNSPQIKKIINEINQVAQTDMTVMIQGESGTGKEVIARLIHNKSKRAEGPFVPFNCGAIPESLLESELFGYEKGAFTGADKRKLGYFEMADGGTLFLDEIGNMPISQQAKLLRCIEEKAIQHLGGNELIPVDVRIIVATNVDLKNAIEEGKFRDDLYHRIREFVIYVPPLRERIEDIEVLADYFRQISNQELKKNVEKISPRALNILKSYNWPGNVRELKNVIKQAVLLADKVIEPYHLQIEIEESIEDSLKLKKIIKQTTRNIEKKMIINALKQAKYNKKKAAEILGINRSVLYEKIKKYNIEI
jgi:DNA-binding NtrC family response regulator